MRTNLWLPVTLFGLLISAGASAQVPRRDGAQRIANSTVVGDQDEVATAVNSSGDFVVAWRADGQDGDGSAIVARPFSGRNGLPLGDEIVVNKTSAGDQRNPAVAMADDGRFVVAWEGPDGAGSTGIFASLRQADGTPIVAEFPVNTSASGQQLAPAVAMQPGGRFLIVWQSDHLFAFLISVINGRIFEANGTGGEEFRINRLLLGDRMRPAAAADPATGGWFTVWDSSVTNILDRAIDFLELLPNGPPPPNVIEIVLNLLSPATRMNAKVGSNRRGEAVAVWEAPDGSGSGIFSRPIIGGVPVGEEQPVNLTTQGNQRQPSVAVDDDNLFVTVWISDPAGSSPEGSPIVVQGRKKSNSAQGNIPAPEEEFRVSTSGANPAAPRVATEPRGNFVVAWEAGGVDDPSDPTGRGALYQRFSNPLFGDDFETGDTSAWSQVVP